MNMATRKKKPAIKKLRGTLWKLCRQYAMLKYPHVCYTCGKRLKAGTSNMQLGHMFPSASCGAFLRYDMRNLRWQCFHCNINLGGNGAEFYRRMTQEVGESAIKKLCQERNLITKTDRFFYEKYIDLYQQAIKELRSLKNRGKHETKCL